MKFYERDLEDLIWEGLETEEGVQNLEEKGFPCLLHSGKSGDSHKISHIRQMNLGAYGRPDIVQIHNQGGGDIAVDIIELKAVPMKIADIKQLCRYMTGFKHMLYGYFRRPIIQGNLITKDCRLETPYMLDHFRNIAFYDFTFDLNKGVSFNRIEDFRMRESSFGSGIKCGGFIGADQIELETCINKN